MKKRFLGQWRFWGWILCAGLMAAYAHEARAVFYNANFQTADLYPGPYLYEIMAEPNITFAGPMGRGFGVNAHVLFPISRDITGHVSAGTGVLPFMFDGHIVYNIFPDYVGQIAFSLGGGMSYLRQENRNHVIVYVYPTISKTLRWLGFIMTPYTYAPIGLSVHQNKLRLPVKIAAGNKLTNDDLKNIFFYFEAGVGIFNAPFLFSFGMGVMFDSGAPPGTQIHTY